MKTSMQHPQLLRNIRDVAGNGALPSPAYAYAYASVPSQGKEVNVKERGTTPAPREKEIQAAIIQAFWFTHRITLWIIDAGSAGMRSGASKGQKGHSGIPAGFPDLLGVIPGDGRALFIEVKRQGEKPRENQAAFLAGLKAKGAVAFWADSVDAALAKFQEAA